MTKLVEAAAMTAYASALSSGLGQEEAKRRSAEVKARLRAELAMDDPVQAAFAHAHRRMGQAVAEAKRLRREKDALLRTLADALNVSESEAWLIARLDMEGDDDGCR